jgi:putative effector of murein hydrolase LrgA (UPF0299 family)
MKVLSLKGITGRVIISTWIISSVISLIWLEVVELRGYKTDLYGLGHVILTCCLLFMALGTCTIFFNRYTAVSSNAFLSGLSFFLLPVLMGIFLGMSIFEQQEIRLFIVMMLSFLAPLTYYFIRYRKQLQQG